MFTAGKLKVTFFQEMIAMKKTHEAALCSRCGVQLSQLEILNVDGVLCAFCENIQSEGRLIRERKPRGDKIKLIVRLKAQNVGDI